MFEKEVFHSNFIPVKNDNHLVADYRSENL